MRSSFGRLSDRLIVDAVTDAWGLEITSFLYLPEGAGAYHWVVHAGDGTRWFVTCDDLDTKPWLGADRDIVFQALLTAYRTADDLRSAGLEFVVAPVPSRTNAPAVRLDDRHSVAVLEYVDGHPGAWGRTDAPSTVEDLVALLARLHRSTPKGAGVLRRALEVPDRHQLEQALADVGRPWHGGPYAEPARHELATHASEVHESLAALDRVAARTDATTDRGVLTHGEPHPGNLIRTASGLRLIDWDTIAFAPPERDLWMLADATEYAVGRYRELTGVTLDPELLRAYRLVWALADLAAYTADLRREHERTLDSTHALAAIRDLLAGREPAPYRSPVRGA